MVELDGFADEMRAEMERLSDQAGREAIERWVEITNELLRNAPVGIGAPRSGEEWNLDAIAETAEISQDGDQWVAEWTAETDDGIPLIDIFEFGADPHIIEGNPILHWTDPETGEDVFRARVKHPGVPEVAAVRIGKGRMEMELESGDLET